MGNVGANNFSRAETRESRLGCNVPYKSDKWGAVTDHFKSFTRSERDWPKEVVEAFEKIGGDQRVATIKLYTMRIFYGQVNRAIVLDQQEGLRQWGGYICTLKRYAFSLGTDKGFFRKTCYRGFNVQDIEKLKKFRKIASTKRGPELIITSFASATCNESIARPYAGNVFLEIDCSQDPYLQSCLYIAPYSETPADEEVLFLPYTCFEVVSFKDQGGVLNVKVNAKERIDVDSKKAGKYSEYECGSAQKKQKT